MRCLYDSIWQVSSPSNESLRTFLMKCAGATSPILLPKSNKKGGLVRCQHNLSSAQIQNHEGFFLGTSLLPCKKVRSFYPSDTLCSIWPFGKFKNFQLKSPAKAYSSAMIAAIKTHILPKNFSVWCFYKQHSHKQSQSVMQKEKWKFWKWAFRLEDGSGRGIHISEKQTLCRTYTWKIIPQRH